MKENKSGLTPAGLLYKIRSGEDIFLLDVRNEEDHANWKFELVPDDQQINVPYIDFIEEPDESADQVPSDREVVVLCAKGGASDYVANILKEKGHTATNLGGGMKAFGDLYQAATIWQEGEAEVVQFDRVGKGCLSYIVRSGQEAAIIDPGRHIDHYLDYLLAHNQKLRWIFDTHLHADHISGAAELTQVTGATYYANAHDMAGAKVSYQPLCDGQSCALGDSAIKAESLKTPGHTPGSTVIKFADKILFTGDTLFLSSLGRPDLGGQAREWAHDLWNTVRALEEIDGDTLVAPAHTKGEGERQPGGGVSALLSDLRRENPLLNLEEEEEFIESIIANLPPEPDSYQKMRQVNLGVDDPSEEERTELELGRNRCAIEQANELAGEK